MSKKRQDLINHAERLFYENGFHSVGLKRVISEANVALPIEEVSQELMFSVNNLF